MIEKLCDVIASDLGDFFNCVRLRKVKAEFSNWSEQLFFVLLVYGCKMAILEKPQKKILKVRVFKWNDEVWQFQCNRELWQFRSRRKWKSGPPPFEQDEKVKSIVEETIFPQSQNEWGKHIFYCRQFGLVFTTIDPVGTLYWNHHCGLIYPQSTLHSHPQNFEYNFNGPHFGLSKLCFPLYTFFFGWHEKFYWIRISPSLSLSSLV